MKAVWQKKAVSELNSIFNFIQKESPQNAVLVFNSILDLAESLISFPYKFPTEPIINEDKVRYAVIWSFKIIYSIEKEAILILRVFSTKQKPKKLKI